MQQQGTPRREADAWDAVLSTTALKPTADTCHTSGPSTPQSLAVPHTHCSAKEQQEWAQVLAATEPLDSTDPGPASAPPPATHHDSTAERPPFVAVIECGSHSTRALICTASGREVARLGYDTHLSTGLVPGAPLQPAAIQRCVEALLDIRSNLHALYTAQTSAVPSAACTGSTDRPGEAGQAGQGSQGSWEAAAARYRVVGTMALRQCSNPGDVGTHIRRLFGADLQILSGEEEGRLCYLGVTRCQASATHAKSGSKRLVVVDMGGMSTELTWSSSGYPGLQGSLESVSLPLGCVGLTTTYFTDLTGSTDSALSRCSRHVGGLLSSNGGASLAGLAGKGGTNADAEAQGSIEVVLTGGTATTVAALLLALPYYDAAAVNAAVVSRTQLLGVAAILLGDSALARNHPVGTVLQPAAQAALQAADACSGGAGACAHAAQARLRASFAWLSEARAQTLASGACALAALLQWLGVEHARVSDADLLDGAMHISLSESAL